MPWLILYLIAAFLFGFWPFEEGWLRTSDLSPLQYTYDQGFEDGYVGALPKIRSGEYWYGYTEGDFYGECEWLKNQNRRSEFDQMHCGSWSEY